MMESSESSFFIVQPLRRHWQLNIVFRAKIRKLNNLRTKSDWAKITLAVFLRSGVQPHSFAYSWRERLLQKRKFGDCR